MSSSESRSGLVMQLAEEFLDRYRRGERPPLKEYIERHPEMAAEIREVFPAMAMMERIAITEESLDDDETAPALPKAPFLKQLGDFRIIREVGHGGMGIVYEAEQVSLGRHVALKVLPAQMVRDAKHKRRFEREARSAAKLHHTNIVPVFGVGEHDGTPYYVMQFIQGLGLDAVLDELKRLKTQPAGAAGEGKPDSLPGTTEAALDLSVANLAHSLLTGRFQPAGQPDLETEPRPFVKPSESGVVAITASLANPNTDRGLTGSIDSKTHIFEDPVASSQGKNPTAPGAASSRTNLHQSSSSISILGQSNTDSRHKPRKQTFCQGIARIGHQVAEALSYAHQQSIVHRDIKPSNLLLDTRGTVWVTDFGLAKADDQQNLTHTGDILGTLRYIPPEAFEGKSDRRGDVYSLGLTLYELLAFRPAFDEKERGRLVKQVTTQDPPRLRSLNPDVPRDLETIIHKAIEREPSHRYALAADLAADLQRFLDDEPIQARRTTAREHIARWCRRNPGIAALASSLLLLMVATTIGSFLTARQMSRLATKETRSAARADQERRAAEKAALAAEAASTLADSERSQAEANFAQARAAVDDYLTKVSDSQLLTAPGLQPLRRELLSSALKFYDDFLKQRREDPSIRVSRAKIYMKVGSIQRELGDTKLASAPTTKPSDSTRRLQKIGPTTKRSSRACSQRFGLPAITRLQLSSASGCCGRTQAVMILVNHSGRLTMVDTSK